MSDDQPLVRRSKGTQSTGPAPGVTMETLNRKLQSMQKGVELSPETWKRLQRMIEDTVQYEMKKALKKNNWRNDSGAFFG